MIGKAIMRRSFTAIAFGLTLLQISSTAVMAAGPGVHGRVLGHDEQGTLLGIVAGAKIQFETSSGSKVAQTTSDGNGYYKVDLPAGEYLYKIDAPGYRKEDRGRGMRLSQSQGYAIFNLSLTKGMDDPNRKPPEIPVRKTGTLAGRVLERTPKGLIGIPDAKISLRQDGSNEMSSAQSRTTADGKHDVGDYQVGLDIGTFHASVQAAGFDKLVEPAAIEIKANQETLRDFILIRTRTPESGGQGIRGSVSFVDSESPPPVIHVQITPLGESNRSAIDVPSIGSGAFKQTLPPGRYRVTASADGYPTAASPPVYVLKDRFAAANLTLRARRVPEPKTSIEAFVFTKSPRGGDQIPLAGARVSLTKTGAGLESAVQSTSDSTGHALFPLTAAGEFTVSASLQGYRPGSGSGEVEAGKSHQIEIELAEESGPPSVQLSLEVRVNDTVTKLPLAGASILARHESETVAEAAHGTTDGQGVTHLTVKKTGSYTVLAQEPGYNPGGANTSVSLGGSNQATIALQPFRPSNRPEEGPDQSRPPREERVAKPQPITGFVAYREMTGQLRSVANVKLIWERIAPANPPISNFAITNGEGQYEINILTGTFQVRILPPSGFEPSLEQVQVLPETHEKYFIIHRTRPKPPAESIKLPLEGSVVTIQPGGGFAGVAGAEVLFSDAETAERSGSDRSGHFASQMGAGEYRVQVRAQGFEPLDTRVSVRSDMQPLRFVLKRLQAAANASHLSLSVVERGRMGGSVRAVADAKVHVTLDGKPVASGVSDVGGQFSTTLDPGTYAVRVDKPGYSTATDRIVIANRDAVEQVVLSRQEQPGADTIHKAALTVRVTQRTARTQAIRPTAAPLSGANVTVMLGGRPLTSGVTNAAGVFTTPIPAGTYSVKVEAQGFTPAGKMVAVAEGDAELDFQLSPLTTGSAAPEGAAPSQISPLPRDDFGRMRLGTNEPLDVRYVVEYRLKGQTRWTVLTAKPTEREANSALHLAVDRGQIPNSAETRIRLEKGLTMPSLGFGTGLRKL